MGMWMEESNLSDIYLKRKIEAKSRDMYRLVHYREELCAHPRLTYLFVELTNRCNLACVHCGSRCGQNGGIFIDTGLLLQTLETVAEDFAPRTVMICLTGGEPMLHPDFYKIVEKVVELGFPWGMTTNGTLLGREDAGRLKRMNLHSVTISLDGLQGAHEWLRNTPGCFQKMLDAVRAMQTSGILVQITSVIHKRNFCELEALYRLMCDMHVSSWRVINLEPIGRVLEGGETLLLSPEEFKLLLDFIRSKRYSRKTLMDVHFGCSHYLSFEYEREVRDNYFICGAGIYVGSILCNGDIYSCLDIERREELVQGNILSDRFLTVWFERFREFRSNRAERSDRCRKCAERKFCRGDSMHTWDFEKKKPMFCILENND